MKRQQKPTTGVKHRLWQGHTKRQMRHRQDTNADKKTLGQIRGSEDKAQSYSHIVTDKIACKHIDGPKTDRLTIKYTERHRSYVRGNTDDVMCRETLTIWADRDKMSQSVSL